MITAIEARINVTNYETIILANVEKTVSEIIDIISRSIEFHSKNGYTHLIFTPYEKSRFSTVKELEYAQKLFRKILEEAGYTVLENNYGRNILNVSW